MTRCPTWCDRFDDERDHDGLHRGCVVSIIGRHGEAIGLEVESWGRNHPTRPVVTVGDRDDVTTVRLEWGDVGTLVEAAIRAQLRFTPKDVLPKQRTRSMTTKT